MAQNSGLSYLDLVDICDNVHLRRNGPLLYDSAYNSEQLIPLYLTESLKSPKIGLLRPVIIEHLKLENERSRQLKIPETWHINLEPRSIQDSERNVPPEPSVSFSSHLDTHYKRTAALKELCERWRDTAIFEDVCGPNKWRAEMYPIYADPFGPHDHPNDAVDNSVLNFALECERSACALFGFVTYGVHMSIFEEIDGDIRVWVPTRARTKQTWPGYLDNSVAGGIPSGMSMFESLVKECMEEASIEDHIARKNIRAVGAVSYFFRTPKGWLQPEIEYVYDMPIPSGVDKVHFEPKPLDGEVESFELLTKSEVIEKLRAGLFKPNCALVLIDLFIRLGYITPDNEPDFMQIITRLHGRFDFERW